eukprot:1144812-Pelagomonas_calceolata.AAC.6
MDPFTHTGVNKGRKCFAHSKRCGVIDCAMHNLEGPSMEKGSRQKDGGYIPCSSDRRLTGGKTPNASQHSRITFLHSKEALQARLLAGTLHTVGSCLSMLAGTIMINVVNIMWNVWCDPHIAGTRALVMPSAPFLVSKGFCGSAGERKRKDYASIKCQHALRKGSLTGMLVRVSLFGSAGQQSRESMSDRVKKKATSKQFHTTSEPHDKTKNLRGFGFVENVIVILSMRAQQPDQHAWLSELYGTHTHTHIYNYSPVEVHHASAPVKHHIFKDGAKADGLVDLRLFCFLHSNWGWEDPCYLALDITSVYGSLQHQWKCWSSLINSSNKEQQQIEAD